MTREDLIMRGELAAFILSDGTITSFLEELKADLLQAVGNTEPEDEKQRHTLYYRYRGVCDLISHMETYATMAHEAREQDERDQKELKNLGEDLHEMWGDEAEE